MNPQSTRRRRGSQFNQLSGESDISGIRNEMNPVDLEHCRRIGVKEKKAKYPCMIFLKLWNYQTKVNIVKTQADKEIKSQVIHFVQDLSVKLRRCKEY